MKTLTIPIREAGYYSVCCPDCHRVMQVRFNELVLIPANGKMPYQRCPECKEIEERKRNAIFGKKDR